MNADGINQGTRSLAQIENDLLKAEEAFADADARCKEAELQRRAAFDKLNKHQTELDETIAALRQRSIPGSKWHPEASAASAALFLEPEDMVEVEAESNRSSLTSTDADKSAAAEFDRLRTVVRFNGGSPLDLEEPEDTSADKIAAKLLNHTSRSAGNVPSPGFEFNRFRSAVRSNADI